MEKASKWLKSLLSGQKEKHKKKERDGENPFPVENPSTPTAISTPKEKRRWSFRRPPKDSNSIDNTIAAKPDFDSADKKKIAESDAAVIRVFPFIARESVAVEEAAAIKIQAFFRSYLAKKALFALKGIVKLQALVRGHLVRKQATATLRCMQALVTAQARAVAHRIRMAEEAQPVPQRQSIYKKLQQNNQFWQLYETDRPVSIESTKIVEMDISESKGSTKSRKSYSDQQKQQADQRLSAHYAVQHAQHPKLDHKLQISPPPSTLTDMSPRTFSGHFEHYSFFAREQTSPQYSAMSKYNPIRAPFGGHHPECGNSTSGGSSFFPNYMANTKSSRAKVRSQSTPKQRPPSRERQPSKQRPSMDGRNFLQGVKIQRSSQGGSAVKGYQHRWSVKLDNTVVSLKGSECSSTSKVLTDNKYYRNLVAYEPHMNRD